MFRALPCSSSGRLRRNCIYAASGIYALYVNKQEFCASSWRSTKVMLWCTVNQSSRCEWYVSTYGDQPCVTW